MSTVKQNLDQIFDTADIEDVQCFDDKQIEQSFYQHQTQVPAVYQQQDQENQYSDSTELVEGNQSVEQLIEQYKKEDVQIKKNLDEDYNQARDNLRSLLYMGDDLLTLAIAAARDTENPKSIESAVRLMGQLADINTRLLDLTAKKQEVFTKTRLKSAQPSSQDQTSDQGQVINNVTNNTMFVGTPADLAEMLKKAKSEVPPTIDLQNETTNS